MREYEIIVIGGGSAGIAAAIEAYENGCRDILILERDQELGGILLQCIHNGFGLQIFGEELSGPAYAERYMDMLVKTGVQFKTGSMVTHLGANKTVEYVNPEEGYVQIKGKAIILAMGCRERTRGAISIPGYRPSGIWTAGTAQRYLNMEGYMVGRKIFILGSGDIGLIMARRMTLEGAEVLGVAELMPYSNGLPRNMKQCLEDFDIPLYLSHTITEIQGKDRITAITICEVDHKLQPVLGTEKKFQVDTLLLSVGLFPENALSQEADIKIHERTRGPVVNESYETSVSGIFACGNVLHVHDLVDYVSAEGKKAGIYAARYVKKQEQYKTDEILSPDVYEAEETNTKRFLMQPGNGIGYILPQRVNPEMIEEKTEFMFRVMNNYKNVKLGIYRDGVFFKEVKKLHMAPAEMEKITFLKKELESIKDNLTIMVMQEGDGL